MHGRSTSSPIYTGSAVSGRYIAIYIVATDARERVSKQPAHGAPRRVAPSAELFAASRFGAHPLGM
jgi:hypothetical protein